MSKSDEYAKQIIEEGKRRNITERGIVTALATALVESGLKMYANNGDPDSLKYPHEAISRDANSTGLFQQRAPWWGTTADRMDPTKSAGMFYDRLAKLDYNGPGSPGSYAQAVQQSAYPLRYDQRMAEARTLYDRLASKEGQTVAAVTWTGDPVWLEDVLRPALGDRLKTLPGWKDSGHGDFRDIRGIVVHHTGNSRETAQSIRNGRPDLEGPLSQLHIAPDGTVTIVAAGVAWHAGVGAYPWLPTNMANWHMIGIECAWPDIAPNGTYDERQRWPDAQIVAMRDTCAAIIGKLGFTAERVIGHKEWAGRAQGKWDPGNLDMNWFRAEVAKDMRGGFDGHPPIEPDKPGASHPPVIQPPGTPPVGAYAHVLLHYGMEGPDVTKLQTRLKRAYSKLEVDGVYGQHTARCVADYQKLHPPLDVDGIVGPATAAALQL